MNRILNCYIDNHSKVIGITCTAFLWMMLVIVAPLGVSSAMASGSGDCEKEQTEECLTGSCATKGDCLSGGGSGSLKVTDGGSAQHCTLTDSETSCASKGNVGCSISGTGYTQADCQGDPLQGTRTATVSVKDC